jgi:hypothetical protein
MTRASVKHQEPLGCIAIKEIDRALDAYNKTAEQEIC